MLQGKVDDAKRRALNLLDRWNEVVGMFAPKTGYYYEMQGVIEDAVVAGIQAAMGKYEKLPGEREEYQNELRATCVEPESRQTMTITEDDLLFAVRLDELIARVDQLQCRVETLEGKLDCQEEVEVKPQERKP